MKGLNKVGDIVLLGLSSLAVHKVRSGLTAMGILFGVWSVIAMLAINEGASYESQQSLRQMGSDNLLIDSVKPSADESGAAQARGVLNYGITWSDQRTLIDNLPGVVRWTAAHRTQKSAQNGTKLIPCQVIGASPNYLDLGRLALVAGRFVSEADQTLCRNTAILTVSLARRLFGPDDPLDKVIRLGGESFRVVGLVDQPSRTMAAVPSELAMNLIFIPSATDKNRFGEFTVINTGSSRSRERVEVSQLIVQLADEKTVLNAAKVVRSLLSRSHDKRDYDITVPLELIEQRAKQRRLWNIMFFTVASISLLVGGIGIMNIMLASVTERTREIGIRRALGAKRRDIIVQFLVEAVTLTTVGGLTGIALGFAVPPVVQTLLKIPALLPAATMIIPFLMAVIVGLISGLYPAMRAAQLDPIEALRHE